MIDIETILRSALVKSGLHESSYSVGALLALRDEVAAFAEAAAHATARRLRTRHATIFVEREKLLLSGDVKGTHPTKGQHSRSGTLSSSTMVQGWTGKDRAALHAKVESFRPGTPSFFQDLVNEATQMAKQLDSEAPANRHTLTYNGSTPDYQLWALATLCESWVLENFQRKRDEGHCKAHPVPCVPGNQPTHDEPLQRARQTFESIARP